MTPRIETERLVLRGRRLEDFPAYAEMWAHPDVARYTTVNPLSEEEAWTKYARMDGWWNLTGYGFWLVEEKSTGAVIGEVGMADFKRAITPSLEGMPEYGWIIAAGAQRKGYAGEALGAALRWGAQKFRGRTSCCIIDPANAPSIRLAETHGFRRVAIAPYKGHDIVIFHRPAD